jgi:hypothetical protein
MAHWKRAFPSRYFQVADLDGGAITATIARVSMEQVGSDDNAESKLVVHFEEPDTKGLVLNLTRAEAVSDIAGSEDTDRWPGTVIQLVRGVTRYQGKKVGCITVQAPITSDVGF